MKVLVIGDSHTGAIETGLARLRRLEPQRLDGYTFKVRPLGPARHLVHPFFRLRDGYIDITQGTYRQRLPRIPIPWFEDTQFVLFSGPLHSSRLYRDAAWARYEPPGLDGPGAPISEALFTRIVDDRQRHVKSFLQALQTLNLNPVVLEPPRPFRQDDTVTQLGPAKVIAIDRALRTRMRAWLEQSQVPIVPVPEDCIDPDGFTLAPLSIGDGDELHGNDRFGARMVRAFIDGIGR